MLGTVDPTSHTGWINTDVAIIDTSIRSLTASLAINHMTTRQDNARLS